MYRPCQAASEIYIVVVGGRAHRPRKQKTMSVQMITIHTEEGNYQAYRFPAIEANKLRRAQDAYEAQQEAADAVDIDAAWDEHLERLAMV